jgi:hypothetical protein
MSNLQQILKYLKEAKSVGRAFLVTGAFGPYTRAHEEMARSAAAHAASTGHTHFYHGIGASELKPDAPLTHEHKTQIVSGSHKHIAGSMPREHQGKLGFGIVPREHSITPFHQIGHLISKGHRDITVAIGSDQLAKGGLKDQILKHMERHGGFVGPDKQVHDVTVNFHQLGKPRVEGEIPREKLLKQVRGGDYTGVKAGKLRAAVGSGDEELAHEMMPHSVKDKAGYFKLIKGQMDAVQRGIDTKRAEKEAKKATKAAAKPKAKSKKKKVVKESFLKIMAFLESADDPTRKERDHRMYGWGKAKPTAKQLANRKKKDKRTVARRKANESGRTKKGDSSVELDHKNGNANDNSSKNLRVISRKTNRSRNNNKWRK